MQLYTADYQASASLSSASEKYNYYYIIIFIFYTPNVHKTITYQYQLSTDPNVINAPICDSFRSCNSHPLPFKYTIMFCSNINFMASLKCQNQWLCDLNYNIIVWQVSHSMDFYGNLNSAIALWHNPSPKSTLQELKLQGIKIHGAVVFFWYSRSICFANDLGIFYTFTNSLYSSVVESGTCNRKVVGRPVVYYTIIFFIVLRQLSSVGKKF